jgi:hypothetical protein
MQSIPMRLALLTSALSLLTLCSCSTTHYNGDEYSSNQSEAAPMPPADYAERIPQHIATNERTVVVDPRVHVWGAYNSNGDLEKAGIASAGSDWCPDLGRRCHTKVGSFRVFSLGSESCKSHIFPLPRGGAPMPYCMFFNTGQALHGVSPNEVGEGNFSHGCVRLEVQDAEWLRYNFVNIGTRVIVKPYS